MYSRYDAIRKFHLARSHIYAVGTIDEGIEVLTGMPSGERGETGQYPEGTINERAEKKFIEYSERPKKIGATLNSRMARQVKD
jgi:hypothetical protein